MTFGGKIRGYTAGAQENLMYIKRRHIYLNFRKIDGSPAVQPMYNPLSNPQKEQKEG